MSKLTKALTAAAGNAGESLYVEDVFSTYLYVGNSGVGSTQSNGLDLSGEGGLVWIKNRDNASANHSLFDTERGGTKVLYSDGTASEQTGTDGISFLSNGWSTAPNGVYDLNSMSADYASWSFRKAEKFFDVVTYTGNGSVQSVNHNLGSVPACMIVKRTDSTGTWYVYHVDLGVGINGRKTLKLNSTAAQSDSGGFSDHPTDTAFTVNYAANTSGATYVAYLFASDAGGFGDDGSESIIKCGSYTGSNGSGKEINLGFEPQWVLVKNTSRAGQNWVIVDNMRQFDNTGYGWLYPNSSAAEASGTGAVYASPTATGFKTYGNNAAFDYLTDSYIYIAIRRPMKTPESGTEVFDPSFRITGDPTIASGFVTDMGIVASRTGGGTSDYHLIGSRLTGNLGMTTTSTNAEVTRGLEPLKWDYNNGWGGSDTASSFAVWYSFKRATGFFDVVAYTGDGVAGRTVAHNLGVAPEMIIIKQRNASGEDWKTGVNFTATNNQERALNAPDSLVTLDYTSYGVFNGQPTAANITLNSSTAVNASSSTYIAYLFATLAGVSKVGSYTGTGSNVDVDCGFSAGARFILIKRTDSTGDWYVWDSERGIVAGNDPYLLLNSTAAEVTTTDYIDPLSSGFTVTSSAPAALNASGGNYIFLAIAQVT